MTDDVLEDDAARAELQRLDDLRVLDRDRQEQQIRPAIAKATLKIIETGAPAREGFLARSQPTRRPPPRPSAR